MDYLPRERERESSAMKGYSEKARRKRVYVRTTRSLPSLRLSLAVHPVLNNIQEFSNRGC